MKIGGIAISTSNMPRTIEFFETLGFEMLPEVKGQEAHRESKAAHGQPAIMIDSEEILEEIVGETPKPSNHSSFAIEYNSREELDSVVNRLQELKFTIVKTPWEAFWGQYYCVVKDPSGYMVDLYVNLTEGDNCELENK